MKQGPRTLGVNTFHIPAYEVPYLEADVRGISRQDSQTKVEPSNASDLKTRMADLVATPGSNAVVMVLSAPMVNDLGGGLKPLDLIRQLAKASRRNLLLVLDLTQVDSDRTLGVFGNSPYRNFQEELAKIGPDSTETSFFVLCSASPGQKSWMVDGLGRSIFLYFLERGLAGEARGWDPTKGPRGPITINGLQRYVSKNVSEWSWAHRQAKQNPWMLSVGGQAKNFSLRQIAAKPKPILNISQVKTSSEKTESKAKGADKAGDSKEAVVADPWITLFNDLIAEWKEHERLQEKETPPHRFVPLAWRFYESAVTQADRLARFAKHDERSLTIAATRLDEATRLRLQLSQAVRERESLEDQFPFRPVLSGEDGKKTLNDSLIYVTGMGLSELAPKLVLPTSPSKPAEPNESKSGESRKASLNVDEVVAPSRLRDAAFQRPETYLELQLPAWAYRFNQEFKVDQFKGQRGAQLREAVLQRFYAESALARDRRGLDWISELIRKGDDTRRNLQDELFAQVIDSDALAKQTVEFGEQYREALARIEQYHKARVLLERIAAELPYLGEWFVLDDARTAAASESTTETTLSPLVSGTISAAVELILALELGHSSDKDERRVAFERLGAAFDQADKAFSRIRDEFRRRTSKLASDQDCSWRELDDALGVPLLPTPIRSRLIQKIVDRDTIEPESLSAPKAGNDVQTLGESASPDGGFWRKALGLARLELEMLRLAAANPKTDLASSDIPALLKQIPESPGLAVNQEALSKSLLHFEEITRAFYALRKASPSTEAQSVAEVRALDRNARFRSFGDASTGGGDDRATTDFDDLSRRNALLFHAQRLALDYAPDVDGLKASVDSLFPRIAGPAVEIPDGVLRAKTDSEPIAIREDRRAQFNVNIEVEGSRPGAVHARVPEGRAFVGVVPDPGDVTKSVSTTETPAKKEEARLRLSVKGTPDDPRLTGLLVHVGAEPPPRSEFSVEQVGNSEKTGTLKHLLAKVFYRGRVEDGNGSMARVAVSLRDFGPPVKLTIAQDREALERKYGKEIARTIADQFEDQQDNAYMHFRHDLEYALTIQNQRPEAQDLVLLRTLEPEGGDAPPKKLDNFPIPLRLKPGGKTRITGMIKAAQVEVDKPMAMVVRVLDSKNEEISRLRVVFHQLRLEDYLTIRTNEGFADNNGDGRKELCLLVIINRREGDPVTEPILNKDLAFAIEDQPPRSTLEEGGVLNRGQAITVNFPIFPNDKVLKWRVVVEGESRTGDYRVAR